VADLFFLRVPMPLLTVEAAGLQVELAELGTGLGVVGFDRPPLVPSSTGWTVCLKELLEVSLGSDATGGDDCMAGGAPLEAMPVSALLCEQDAPTALFLHMRRHTILNKTCANSLSKTISNFIQPSASVKTAAVCDMILCSLLWGGGAHGSIVVKELCNKTEGRGFEAHFLRLYFCV
jgi:hypothetical protein